MASIQCVGTYSSGNFHISSGSNGTVEITDPTVFNVSASTVSYSDTALLQAINSASNGNVIQIIGSGQIALSEPLTIDKDITIEGQLLPNGTPSVTIEAAGFGNEPRVLRRYQQRAHYDSASVANVSISNLIIAGAGETSAAPGGADGDDGDDGGDGEDGTGDTGGNGTAGGNGVGATPNADNAIGTIANNGVLTLNNDFVHGAAVGGEGGAGDSAETAAPAAVAAAERAGAT